MQRIWRAHGLHRVRKFKLSNDPQFAAKLRDIVGLYVTPPDQAIVPSIDEKSQMQAQIKSVGAGTSTSLLIGGNAFSALPDFGLAVAAMRRMLRRISPPGEKSAIAFFCIRTKS